MLLLALFIGVPLIEIALFVQLGSVLDLGWILLIVVLTAILGTWLVRRQGRDVLRQIQGSLERLNDPTEPLAHGAMILFSGALLLTPGFFTDTVGFLLLVPAIREVAFRWIRARVLSQTTVHTAGFARGPTHANRTGAPRHPSDVIDGDYRDVTKAAGEPPRNDGPASGQSGAKSRKPSGWTEY
ncbi:MAG: FxsA family protein [Pseudomonadota bacterium]